LTLVGRTGELIRHLCAPNNRFIALSKFPEVDTLKASWLLWSNILGKLGFDQTLVP